MNIYKELSKKEIGEYVYRCMEEMDREALVQKAKGEAMLILSQIQKILAEKSTDDFEKVEKIVCLFEKSGLNHGGCHDFS